MLPSQGIIAGVFASQHPLTRSKAQPQPEAPAAPASIKRNPFPAWSAIDDVKNKAEAIGNEASREFNKGSKLAQSKTGHIEPWTPKYYAACTFGGLLACVSKRASCSVLEIPIFRRRF